MGDGLNYKIDILPWLEGFEPELFFKNLNIGQFSTLFIVALPYKCRNFFSLSHPQHLV